MNLVHADVPGSGPIEILADQSWSLQKGDKAQAYRVISQVLKDYLTENDLKKIVVMGSAVNPGGTTLAHLEGAELRGVVIAAAAEVGDVTTLTKANLSRTFGGRKADDYLKDNDYWSESVVGLKLKVGSRPAALLLLSVQDDVE